MDAQPSSNPLICPECGAKAAINASKCWICKRPLASDVPVTAELAGGAAEHRATFQFGISSIMLIITLAAVILGVWQMAPGIGIALAIVAIMALIPTCIISMQKGARGRPMTPSEKISLFMVWLGLAAVVLIAAGIAFVITCYPLGLVHAMSPMSINPWINPWIVGAIAGLFAAVPLSVFFWRKFRRRF
jgi:hypothetical protein